jgi:hypothetical protein
MPRRTDESRRVVRRIADDERRARLGVRHRLTGRTGVPPDRDAVAGLAADLVALHATDPASVYLAAAARVAAPHPDDVARALYEDRSVIRMLGMRRTMFVVPTGLAPVIQHSSSDAVAARIRRVLVKELEPVVPSPDRWLRDLGDSVVVLLRDRGEATGAELSRAEPRLRTQLVYAEGKAYGGPANITSRVLNLLSAEGRIVRGRPGGGWTGSQYRWSPIERWLPDGLPRLTADEARAELVGLWLRRFGPGTVEDLRWWTGWNLGEVRKALAATDTVAVELDGRGGLVLASDVDPVAEPDPWIALLPALDPTPMGWTVRDWYLAPEHRAALFDRSGNIGPTVWCDGRIVGGWAQRADGEVVWRLLEDIGGAQTAAVAAEAARLTAWHDGVRVTPRFRTPLEKELAGPR